MRGELGDIVAVGVGFDFEFGSCFDCDSDLWLGFGLVLLLPIWVVIADGRICDFEVEVCGENEGRCRYRAKYYIDF